MSDIVTNELDQSDLGKLQEILTMVQSLLQGASVPGVEAEAPVDLGAVEMAAVTDPTASTEETELQEVDVEKAVIDETGDSKAEDRLSNVTELTDQSLSEIGKSLISLIAEKKVVKKSAPVNPMAQAINKLTEVVKGMAVKFNNQEIFNDTLMKGMRFTEEVVEKNLAQDTGPKSRPVQSVDNTVILKALVEQLESNNKNPETKNPWNDKRGVNKNIGTLLNSLAAGQK